jgi:hypothetical protein
MRRKTNQITYIGIGLIVGSLSLAVGIPGLATNSRAKDPGRGPVGVSAIADELEALGDQIQPTDWAYQSLNALVKRYGCIPGYPELETYPGVSFKGNHPMTRLEFASGINVCIDRLNELLENASNPMEFLDQTDRATILCLQEMFEVELGRLRQRTDSGPWDNESEPSLCPLPQQNNLG